MGSKSSIEWTDATWNPIRGCSMAKGSEKGGCLNCYAARFNARNLPGMRSPTTGKPFAVLRPSGPRWTGDVELIESQLGLPLRWRKPKKIFVNSQSDLFHEDLPDEAIDRVFAMMFVANYHTYQILTKRSERMHAYLTAGISHFDARRRIQDVLDGWGYGILADRLLDGWPLPNVWLGVSVENQATADARIPFLLKTPAALRFVSYEPALGPVDFTRIEFRPSTWYNALEDHDGWGLLGAAHQKLDWIIVGGESGPGARPFDLDWIQSLKQQLSDPFDTLLFVKQLGRRPIISGGSGLTPLLLNDPKGGDWDEWPFGEFRIRQVPIIPTVADRMAEAGF